MKPTIVVQNQQLEVYTRDRPYKYLGMLISVNGQDEGQVIDLISTYKTTVVKISESQSPLTFKVCAFNNMALAKVLHHFCNMRIEDGVLNDLDDFLTEKLRSLFQLYKSTTRDIIIYHVKWEVLV